MTRATSRTGMALMKLQQELQAQVEQQPELQLPQEAPRRTMQNQTGMALMRQQPDLVPELLQQVLQEE